MDNNKFYQFSVLMYYTRVTHLLFIFYEIGVCNILNYIIIL